MGEACEHHMFEQSGLTGQRLVDFGMRVTVGAGPPRGDEVKQFAPLRVEQGRALRPRDDERVATGPVLGEGMPDMVPILVQHISFWFRVF